MAESIENVKAAVVYLRRLYERVRPDMKDEMAGHADNLELAADDLVRLYGLTSALPPDLGNIYDLPAELLKELSVSKTDELEDQLVTVINAYGGEASLDQILVGLFRKFEVQQKRRFIQNKLYRMDTVWSVEGKKGVYTTTEPPEDETSKANGHSAYDSNASYPNSASSFDLDDDIPF